MKLFKLVLVALAIVAEGLMPAQTVYTPGGTVGASTNGFSGVGTSSPLGMGLTISGDTPNLFIQDTAASGQTYYISSRWGGYFTLFNTNSSTPYLSFGGSGNMGVGVTIPGNKLDVAGSAVFGSAYAGGGAYAPANGLLVQGAVGIANTAPDSPLTVNGNIHIVGPSVGLKLDNSGAISALDTSGTVRNLIAGWSDNNVYVGPTAGFADTYLRAGSGNIRFSLAGVEKLTLLSGGNVGIGTTNPGSYKLAVAGSIHAQEVVIDMTGWSDYVFGEQYKLQPLSELEAHIKAEKHLPGIPSASEVAEKGISVGEMQAKLLAKIEELTLHQIEQEKGMSELKKENEGLKARVAELECRGK